jgi:eukaryotic-like serine/threonine-protein kinase
MLNLTQTEWREAMTLLDQVMDLDRDEQQDALRRSTAPDKIRKAVQRLLSNEDDTADDVLDQGAFNLVAPVVKSDDEFDKTAARALETLGSGTGGRRMRPGELEPGTTVGSFQVEHLLGRGGMGEVYLAKRIDDFEQEVALKLVRVAGLGSEEVERRFKRERQILAGLRHENIARLIDGGVTEDRRPYLAMEYVKGEKITDYADRSGLNIDERMALFEQACRAVRYAHRRAIIHRDLKPSNLMVEEQHASSGDGQPGKGHPVVKLLDFGIAKLLEADEEPLTRGGERLMTPEYAAPEQVAGDPVTTSTDVYQLGVLMYELLTGRRPFYDVTEGKSGRARVRAAEDAILGKDPERPSRVMTRSVETLRKTHGMDPKRLAGRVRGDLDAIVQKALRKEPGERYSSVTELLEDMDRYRNGHPVQARSGTWSYRAKKFLRRNRTPVIAGTIAALILIGFMVSLMVTTSQLSRALTEVQAESERRENVQGLFLAMVDVADPNRASNDTLTVRNLLTLSQEKAAEEFADDPELKAWAYTRLAEYERRLGYNARVIALADTAKQIYQDLGVHTESASPQMLLGYSDALIYLAESYREGGEIHKAAEFAREGVDVIERLKSNVSKAGFITKNRRTDSYLVEELEMREVYLSTIRRTDSMAARREVNTILSLVDEAQSRSDVDISDEDLADVYSGLARYWRDRKEWDRAYSLFKEAIRLNEKAHGYESLSVAQLLTSVAVMYAGDMKTMSKSLVYLKKSYKIYKNLYRPESIKMVAVYDNLGAVNFYLGNVREAKRLFDEAVSIATQHPDYPELELAVTLSRRADADIELGNYEEAIAGLNRARVIRVEKYGMQSVSTVRVYRDLARAKWKVGDIEKARELFETSLEIYKALDQVDDPDAMENAGINPNFLGAYSNTVKAYVNFQREHGSKNDLCQALAKRVEILRRFEGDRKAEAIDNAQSKLTKCDSFFSTIK